MTLRELVNELRAQGHQIEYYNRKDGSILIRSIDGVDYKDGAAGNKVARAMGQSLNLNAELSQARKTQLKIIKPKGKRTKLPKALEVKLQKVQKLYNKNKVPIAQGRITKRLIREIYKEEGEKAARKKLTQAQRYAEGFATNATIEAFIEAIRHYQMAFKQGSQEYIALTRLIADIKLSSGIIKDEYIYPAYKELYEIKRGNVSDVIDNVRKTLRLW